MSNPLLMTFTLGTLTFGGYILFETATEICVMMTGEWQTERIPKTHVVTR